MFGSRKKVNLQISYFSATITKPSVQVKMEEGGGHGGEAEEVVVEEE